MSNYPMIKKEGQHYTIGVDCHNGVMGICVMTASSEGKMIIQYADQFEIKDYQAEVAKIREFYKGCSIIREV